MKRVIDRKARINFVRATVAAAERAEDIAGHTVMAFALRKLLFRGIERNTDPEIFYAAFSEASASGYSFPRVTASSNLAMTSL